MWASARHNRQTLAGQAASSAQQASLLADDETARVDATIDDLERKFGRALYHSNADDAGFPPSLSALYAEDRPQQLFALGNLALLAESGVGICGSRDASSRALDIAGEVVGMLAHEGQAIVSGYARGVDQIAHAAALDAGGKTIIVLPEGLARFSIRKDLRSLWDWERILVVSQFSLQTPWKSWNAMRRNRTIMGLSRAMLVVEAKSNGGTFDAGKVALAYRKPVFAVDFSDIDEARSGNRILIDEGAMPLKRDRISGAPNIRPIIEAVSN